MMQEKRRFRAEVYALLLAAALFVPKQVMAQQSSCTAQIPVKVEVSEPAPENTEFEVILAGENQDTPMPGQSTGIIKGNGEFDFGPILYTIPGDYHYSVYQKTGNALYFTYDTSVYDVTVRVVNTDNGGLDAKIWAVRQGEEEKQSAICFSNSYKPPAISIVPSSPPKTAASISAGQPKTGDTMRTELWCALLAGSVCAGAGVVKRRFLEKK